MRVVIPAAGRGTRFFPATKAMPKEMLPVLNRPVIQYVVEEAVRGGATELVIVTGPTKRAIEAHFAAGNGDLPGEAHPSLRALSELQARATIRFIDQGEVRGLGGAILSAEDAVGSERFGVLLGDSIHVCDPPLLSQLLEVANRFGGQSTVLALEPVADDRLSWYGIATGSPLADGVLEIEDVVEKPRPDQVSSRLAVTGAYLLSPSIFGALRETAPDQTGEVQVTDAIRKVGRQERILGVVFRGRRYDTGNPLAWLEANLLLAAGDPAYRALLESLPRRIRERDFRVRAER